MLSSASCSGRLQLPCLGPVMWLMPSHRPPHLALTKQHRLRPASHGRRAVTCASSHQSGLRARWCIDVRWVQSPARWDWSWLKYITASQPIGGYFHVASSHRSSMAVPRTHTLTHIHRHQHVLIPLSRYGCKSDATLLLQEWVRDVGSKAGLSAANTRLSSGSIGVPESRLELEVSFPTLSDWEIFLNSIPFKYVEGMSWG